MGTFIGVSTGIGSSSNDVNNNASSILQVLPILIYNPLLEPNVYLYFLLKNGVVPLSMKGTLYLDNRIETENPLISDGLQWMYEYPPNGTWYADLEIVIDPSTTYNFISNTLII